MEETSATADAIYKLSQPKLSQFGIYLLLDWLGVVAGFTIFASFHTVVGFLAASVVLGLSQHGLIVLGHEAVHYTICRNRALNEWIGRVFCFFPLGLTVSSYREFHFPHHRDPFGQSDPELPLRKAMGKNFEPPYTIARGFKLWALSFLGLSLKELIVFSAMLPGGSKKERLYMVLFLSATCYGAYRAGVMSYVGLWSFGLVTTYFSMLRIQGWYEHGLPVTNTNRYDLPSFLYRFIMPHNIWVHYEHHKYSSVPFYNLEKVRLLDKTDRIYKLDEMVSQLAVCDPLKQQVQNYKRAA